MAIIKDVTVKINNGIATLDAPVQFYEKDHDVELRFKLMDYKYKYDKDPQNILNSVDEDILEAYTTIVNPKGYELEQINGVVKNDVVIFRLDPTYTDELDELGTYKLQIHIKCTHSEFTIPPITFEVLQRLKGIKVVTDGKDEVDNSEILDNSSKFVSDETGKLIIEWKKGDMISSAKLNAMVDVINDAVDEEAQRQLNEVKREQQELEREQQELERQNELQEALDSVDARVDESMTEYETRFNALTVSQQQDMEVIDARDGEVSLKARLDRDLRNPLQVYEDVEGSYISCDSVEGYAQNVEILGNTVQDQNDLADIRSVGDKVEGQELYEIPVLSCGKNLFNGELELGYIGDEYGDLRDNINCVRSVNFIKVNPNKTYIITNNKNYSVVWYFYDINYNYLGCDSKLNIPPNCSYAKFRTGKTKQENDITVKFQLEEGTQATPFEEYQEHKLTILSPIQLEKVGDVADRIICKDGVWGVEKNVKEYALIPSNVTFNEYIADTFLQYHVYDILVDGKGDADGICNINDCFKSISMYGRHDYDKDYISCWTSTHIAFVTKLNTFSGISDFKSSLPEVINFKYITTQPTFIPLPHDQQIKLRTFANKTSIQFLTEIEPTLKASVPKSLSATVNTHSEQIDNLGKEIDKIKKLEESVASEVVTESDFTTVENTSNGYFEDVKLEGRTLVNLNDIPHDWVLNTLGNIVYLSGKSGGNLQKIQPNTIYTIILYGLNDKFQNRFTITNIMKEPIRLSNGVGVLTTKDTIDNNLAKDPHLYGENLKTQDVENVKLVILEGDHTQNPPEYFEGIKSVGQDVDDITIATTNAPMLFGKGGKK